MIKIEIKSFEELNTKELHDILQLRSEIFVVEQTCIYLDVDGKDPKALHIIGSKEGEIIAYARIFRSGDYFKEAAIGRVAVKKNQRKYGYGKDIMKASIAAVERHFNESVMRVSAQLYLERFYHSLGFEQVAEGYLEDGIPHIGMVLKN